MKASKFDYVMAKINSYKPKNKFEKLAKKQAIERYQKRASDIENLQWSQIKSHLFDYEIQIKGQIEEKKAILRKKVSKLERHAYAPEMNTLWFKSGKCRTAYQCTTIEAAIAYVISPFYGNEMTIEDCKVI
jgi:hypothetical protein